MAETKTFNQLIIDRKNHLVLLDGKPVEHTKKLTLVLDGSEWDLKIERVEFYTGSTREKLTAEK